MAGNINLGAGFRAQVTKQSAAQRHIEESAAAAALDEMATLETLEEFVAIQDIDELAAPEDAGAFYAEIDANREERSGRAEDGRARLEQELATSDIPALKTLKAALKAARSQDTGIGREAPGFSIERNIYPGG